MLLFAAQDEVVAFKMDGFAKKAVLHSGSKQVLRMTNVLVLLAKQKNTQQIGLKTYAQK